MSLFEQIGGAGNAQSQGGPLQMLQALRSDPMQMIRQAGYNVPDQLVGDPQGIVQHLIRTGQVQPAMLAQAQSRASAMRSMMGRR